MTREASYWYDHIIGFYGAKLYYTQKVGRFAQLIIHRFIMFFALYLFLKLWI